MSKDTDKAVLANKISRSVDELMILFKTSQEWVPAYRFGKEAVPALRTLPLKLHDIFSRGLDGIIAHVVWTHVHSVGNVRNSNTKGCLDVFGVHGWDAMLSKVVAEESYDNIAARLEKMWFALESKDPRALNTLRPSARKFMYDHSAALNLDPRIFGFFDMSRKSSPSKDDRAKIIDALHTSFIERSQ